MSSLASIHEKIEEEWDGLRVQVTKLEESLYKLKESLYIKNIENIQSEKKLESIHDNISFYQEKTEEMEEKLSVWNEEKIKPNFIKYFNLKKSDVEKMKDFSIKVNYHMDATMYECGYWDVVANLRVWDSEEELFTCEYFEQNDKGTSQHIECDISHFPEDGLFIYNALVECIKKKHPEANIWDDESYLMVRDIIKNIVEN